MNFTTTKMAEQYVQNLYKKPATETHTKNNKEFTQQIRKTRLF